MFIIGLIVGLLVGATLGFLLFALCVVSSDADAHLQSEEDVLAEMDPSQLIEWMLCILEIFDDKCQTDSDVRAFQEGLIKVQDTIETRLKLGLWLKDLT